MPTRHSRRYAAKSTLPKHQLRLEWIAPALLPVDETPIALQGRSIYFPAVDIRRLKHFSDQIRERPGAARESFSQATPNRSTKQASALSVRQRARRANDGFPSFRPILCRLLSMPG